MIDGYVADAQDQEQTLCEAKQRPHVFDDALEMAGLFEQQLRHWRNSGLTVDQKHEGFVGLNEVP
jgi:hypothetical protein